ncbi:ROK family protein [Candidatus Bipolaricaulota bacterium]|nr:ROK family protein [Candidatus Bipolaricaulota bacterium]
MRDSTVLAMLRELWTPSGATRRELEAALGLSRPTVDKALGMLVERGIVVPVGTRSQGSGRPGTVFCLDGSVCMALGVDLELPQVDFVLCNLLGETLHRSTLAVGNDLGDPVALLRQVGEQLAGWLESLGVPWSRVGGAGVAVPAFVRDGVATFAGQTMPPWRGVAVRETLERDVPVPVHVHHDTHLMALVEARAIGWAEGTLLYIALRPGLAGEVRFGASVLVDGHAYRGSHGHGGSLYRAFVTREEMEGRSPKARVDLLVDKAVGFLVHAVTLLDPERIVIHAELLGADEEAFITACRHRLREALEGEFPDLHKLVRAKERGPTAVLGAAVAVVQHLRDNPEQLFGDEGGENGNRAYRPKGRMAGTRKRR